jgi:hypothetical protein
MSVIGRLDKQVDEVLIAPLSKNNRREEDARGPQQRAETQSDEPREIATTDSENPRTRVSKDELPVWLL